MKNEIIRFKIPDGFIVQDKLLRMNIDEAGALMLSKEKKRFISAKRSGATAYLKKSVIKCPYCGYEIPAACSIVKRENIKKWSTRQLSLFGEPDAELPIDTIYRNIDNEIVCAKCRKRSHRSSKHKIIIVKNTKSTLFISQKINNIAEAPQLLWASLNISELPFPLCETLGFNILKGRVFIRLETTDSKVIATSDITERSDLQESSSLWPTINESIAVKREIKRFLLKHFSRKLPFTEAEFTPNHIVQMIRFKGYSDSNFYSAIPYVKGTVAIDSSFNNPMKFLQNAKSVVYFFENSKLPKSKSVKKIFLERPELLFYKVECEKLSDILNNVNFFAETLRNENIFYLLVSLHSYPVIFEMFCDYVRIKGSKSLLSLMKKRLSELSEYAIKYCSMNSYLKSAEQKKWEKYGVESIAVKANRYNEIADDDPKYLPLNENIRYSVPLHKIKECIPTCIIGDYTFVGLRSLNDYIFAGRELNNCLIDWNSEMSPIIIMQKNGKTVAAIEPCEKSIYQAYMKNNIPITQDTELEKAYQEWCNKNQISPKSMYEEVDDI